jgi:hypothetical protein
MMVNTRAKVAAARLSDVNRMSCDACVGWQSCYSLFKRFEPSINGCQPNTSVN